MENPYIVIPRPHELIYRGGPYCPIPRGLTEETADKLARRLRDGGIPEDTLGVRLSLTQKTWLGVEGYELNISDSIEIVAETSHGLFNGMQTLKQILLQTDEAICPLKVRDFPDIKLRCAMIDLRFQTFSMDYICELISRWAGMKINSVCIEYSSYFPYEGIFEQIRSPLAFTKEEIRRFVDHCRAHFIGIIPIVQSFGHMEYLLKHQAFAHLNENSFDGKYFSQCCPLRPESFEASKELIRQVYEAHDRPRIFSIGGDEAMHLGECPECASYAAEYGKGKLFIGYINKLLDYVNTLGTVPMTYSDMLLAHPHLIAETDKRCVIGDWDYWTGEEEPGLLLDWSTKKCIGVSRATELDVHLLNSDGSRFKPFAYTGYLTELGYSVIGHCSTLSVGPSDHFTPNYSVHIPNIKGYAAAVKRYGAMGLVVTAFERFLMDAVSLGIAAGADQMWGPSCGDTFNEQFCKLYYGLKDGEAARAMYMLSAPYTMVEKKWPRVYIKEDFGRRDIPLAEITGNRELTENIARAKDIFSRVKEQASRHKADFDNWLYGAKIKEHWLDIAKAYLDAAKGQDVCASLAQIDVRCAVLRGEMHALLHEIMPYDVIERRFTDAMATYEDLKGEIYRKEFRKI